MKYYIALLPILFLFFKVAANSMPSIDPPGPYFGRAMEMYYFCDTCGCSGSGGSMGFGTALNNNFVGLRYINQKYRSRDGIFDNSSWVNEYFNTVQLWAKYPITERILINGTVPYSNHHRNYIDGSEQHIRGIGDITVLGFFKVLSPRPDSIVPIKPQHSLQLGGGIKLPTGGYDLANNEGSINPSFQLGTGSWDYLLAANYGLTHRNWGLSAMANYTFKTENNNNYRYGDQLNYGINTYRTFYLSDKIALTPILGIGGEHYARNENFGLSVKDTGGDVLFGTMGVEANYKKFSLGATTMLPVSQDLNNGKTEVKNRFSVYLNIII